MGPFDWIYDRDHNGKLDFNEESAKMDDMDFMFKTGIYEDDEDDDDDEWDDDDSELEEAGLSREELELMDEDERIEALEDAGLDPDDWD